MASTMRRDASMHAYGELAAMFVTPVGLEQLRVERLLELRAVIDSLRSDRAQELLVDVQAENERWQA
jgi:hypothetical protein